MWTALWHCGARPQKRSSLTSWHTYPADIMGGLEAIAAAHAVKLPAYYYPRRHHSFLNAADLRVLEMFDVRQGHVSVAGLCFGRAAKSGERKVRTGEQKPVVRNHIEDPLAAGDRHRRIGVIDN